MQTLDFPTELVGFQEGFLEEGAAQQEIQSRTGGSRVALAAPRQAKPSTREWAWGRGVGGGPGAALASGRIECQKDLIRELQSR